MSNKILLTDKLREIIEQAHMAGYNQCCDRSPSAYEARIYCNSVELEAEQIIQKRIEQAREKTAMEIIEWIEGQGTVLYTNHGEHCEVYEVTPCDIEQLKAKYKVRE